MTLSLRNLLLIAMSAALLACSRSARDSTPPPDTYITVELQDGKGTDAQAKKNASEQILDEAALERFRKWKFKPDKSKAPRLKAPMPFRPIPPATPSGPSVI